MGDNNFSPGFHQGVSYSPNDLFRRHSFRHRSSLGADAALGADEDRDPEEVVDDYDELVRCGQPLSSLLVQAFTRVLDTCPVTLAAIMALP